SREIQPMPTFTPSSPRGRLAAFVAGAALFVFAVAPVAAHVQSSSDEFEFGATTQNQNEVDASTPDFLDQFDNDQSDVDEQDAVENEQSDVDESSPDEQDAVENDQSDAEEQAEASDGQVSSDEAADQSDD
ncbi:MAG: hypothetical protein ABIU97_07750, partial [Dehalococcoidia bacterium]